MNNDSKIKKFILQMESTLLLALNIILKPIEIDGDIIN